MPPNNNISGLTAPTPNMSLGHHQLASSSSFPIPPRKQLAIRPDSLARLIRIAGWADGMSRMHKAGAVLLYKLLKPDLQTLVDEGDAEEPWDLRVVDATFKSELQHQMVRVGKVQGEVAQLMAEVETCAGRIRETLAEDGDGDAQEQRRDLGGTAGKGARSTRRETGRRVVPVHGIPPDDQREIFQSARLHIADTVITMRAAMTT
jgi:hypothetical protein